MSTHDRYEMRRYNYRLALLCHQVPHILGVQYISSTTISLLLFQPRFDNMWYWLDQFDVLGEQRQTVERMSRCW